MGLVRRDLLDRGISNALSTNPVITRMMGGTTPRCYAGYVPNNVTFPFLRWDDVANSTVFGVMTSFGQANWLYEYEMQFTVYSQSTSGNECGEIVQAVSDIFEEATDTVFTPGMVCVGAFPRANFQRYDQESGVWQGVYSTALRMQRQP